MHHSSARRDESPGRGDAHAAGRAREDAWSTDGRPRRARAPGLGPSRRPGDPAVDRARSERARFAEQIDRELQVACRMEAAARRELGCVAVAFLRSRAYRRLGFVRVGDYARERLGRSARAVQSAAWVATRLEALPRVGSAFDRSALSWTQARLLCAVAAPADQERWLALAWRLSVAALERLVRGARRPPEVPADPAGDEHEIDGEPAVRLRLPCPARVRALWRRALALAARVAGEPLAAWRAAEIIAAEGFSGRPAGAALADRALIAGLRMARRVRKGSAVDEPDELGALGAGLAGVPITARDPTADGARDVDSTAAPVASGSWSTPANPFALDARLVAAMDALRTTEPRIGRLLRVVVDQRFHRLLGFPSVEAYVRERLGIASRKAWALLKVERATSRSDAFARAYRAGTLSWAQALTLLPVLEREHAPAWVARAAAVTVRRLGDEVNWVLEARDALGTGVPLAPPPLCARLMAPGVSATAAVASRPAVASAAPVTAVAGAAECQKASPAAALQIGAPGTGATHAADVVAILASDDRDRRARGEVCDAEVTFRGPASVVALVRDVLDAFARPGAPRWVALEALLQHVIAYWESTPRHRDPIFARDGWRCTVPGCSARRHLHDHHLRFRSRGGDNAPSNRITICAAHHLHGIHDGTIRAAGTAPDAVHWQLGVRVGAPPLLEYVGDRLCAPAPAGDGRPTRRG